MVPSGKNETKFLKFGACIWLPELFFQKSSKMSSDSAIRQVWPKLRPNRFGRNSPKLRPKLRFRSYTSAKSAILSHLEVVYDQNRSFVNFGRIGSAEASAKVTELPNH